MPHLMGYLIAFPCTLCRDFLLVALILILLLVFFFASRRRHTRCGRDWSSDVCSSDLAVSTSLLIRQSYGRPTKITSSLAPADRIACFDLGARGQGCDLLDDPQVLALCASFLFGLALVLKIGRASCRERV